MFSCVSQFFYSFPYPDYLLNAFRTNAFVADAVPSAVHDLNHLNHAKIPILRYLSMRFPARFDGCEQVRRANVRSKKSSKNTAVFVSST